MAHPFIPEGASIAVAAASAFLHIFPHDFARYLIGAGGVYLIVNLALARRLAGRKIRPSSPGGKQMRQEFATSLRTTAVFTMAGVVSVLGAQAGIIQTYYDAAERGWGYFWFSLLALIVLHDAWFYWTHRLIHDPRLFRRVHRTHHKSNNPSPWTAYSFDVSEAAINAVFLPLALIVLPTSYLAIFLFLLHMIVRNAIGHCGYELMPSRRNGRPLIGWMTTVTHHDLHHAQAGWNYGLYFTWWDRMMGTEHPLYLEKFAAAVRKPLDGSAVGAINAGHVAAMAAAMVVASMAVPPRALADDLAEGSIPQGVYATQGHEAHVVFEPCADATNALCGRMIWTWNPQTEIDPRAYFLGGFSWDGGAWRDGWLENPDDGRTYRGKITPIGDGALELKGCALVFCKTQIWRRVEDIPGCKAPAVD